jgi:hypothetical protein
MSHTTDLPQVFPPEITIGVTLEWEKDFDDFPADEWVVTYYVRGVGPGFDAAGTADGTTHVFSVPPTTSDDLIAGRYDYQALAVKGSEKHLVDEGRTRALASLAALTTTTATYDGRSPAKKILDLIDLQMAGKATLDQQEYMIGGGGSQRMLKRNSLLELIELRKYYAAIVSRENRKGRPNRIRYAQFDPTS